MSYTSQLKDVPSTGATRALGMYLTAYGCKKFQDMNNSRDAAGGAKLGYNPDDDPQQYADPTFLTRDWKNAQRIENGVAIKNEDGTLAKWITAPKYKTVDKDDMEKAVPVAKFLEPSETGKSALQFILNAMLNEFASYTGSEATMYEDHLTRVRAAAENLDYGGILATMHSINSRAVRDNNIELDECLRIWLAAPREAISKYISLQLPATTHASAIRDTFIAFLLQLAHVLGNTQYDALLKPVTHRTIIGALRNLNYSQATGQHVMFDEGFLVAIDDHITKLAKDKALKPKKPRSPAAAAADEESETPAEPAPIKKASGKKAAAAAASDAAAPIKKASGKKAAAAATPAPIEATTSKKAAAKKTPKVEPAPAVEDMTAGWGEEFDGADDEDDSLYADQ